MYKIVKKQELTTNIYLMEVEANRVAKTCEPGQFVIVRMDSEGERIPLTICDYNREKGTVTIVFQTVGAGTKLMAQLEEGEYFHDFVGPLGCPSELVEQPLDEVKAKKILFVAGGVGAAPVYPQVKWLHEHGIAADVIVGSKTKNLLILEKEMEAVAGNLYGNPDHQRSGSGRQKVRSVHRYRPHDHDEIRMSPDQGTGDSHRSQPEPHYGRWNGNVRCLSCHCRRQGKIRLRRRSRIRRTRSKL